MPALRKAIGYIRISDTNGRSGENYISPDSQADRIRKLAAARGFRIVRFERDDDVSGGTNHRPGLQAAIEACEAREAAALLTAYHSRFARSSSGTYQSIERLSKVEAEYHADDLPAPGTEGYKIMLAVVAANAEIELDRIGAQWADARARAISRGVYLATTAPLGYCFDADHRLVPGDDAEAVREVFRGRAAGLTWKALAEQYRCATGREISAGSLDRVVANRVYLGEIHAADQKPNLAAHEPLVTVDEFRAANARTVQRAPRSNESTALLGAATLRCGSCGRTMSYRGGEGGQYVCNRSTKGEPCAAPVLIHASKLDPYVEAALVELIGAVEAEGSVEGDDLAAAEQRLAEATSELQAYIDSGVVSVIGADAFRSGAEQRQARIEAAQDEVDAIRESRDLDDRLVTIGGEWGDLARDDQRRIAAAALATVTVHRASRGRWTPLDERVEIAFAGATSDADRVAA